MADGAEFNLGDIGSGGTAIQVANLHGQVVVENAPRRPGMHQFHGVSQIFRDRRNAVTILNERAEAVKTSKKTELVVVSGHPGIGRTALVNTWMRHNSDTYWHSRIAVTCGGGRFPGRGITETVALFLRKHGYDPATQDLSTPKAATQVLCDLLPSDSSAIILLDDPQTAAEVTPLLQGRGLLVIVTGPPGFPGLADQSPTVIKLDPLPDADIRGLIGDIYRAAPDDAGIDDLVWHCAGNPLIATLAAALLQDSHGFLSARQLVARMRAEGRIPTLEAVPMADDASHIWAITYDELTPTGQALYRGLGAHPTPEFDHALAHCLLDTGSSAAGDAAVKELLRRGLIHPVPRSRYRMDDLTHEHAAHVAAGASTEERQWVWRRVLDYYTYGAIAADARISHRWRVSPRYWSPSPVPLPRFLENEWDTLPTPRQWLEDNLSAVMACMDGGTGGRSARPGFRAELAEFTHAYLGGANRSAERQWINERGLADAIAIDDPDRQARILAQQGEEQLKQGNHAAAEALFHRSLDAAERGTITLGRGAALEWLGLVHGGRGETTLARDYLDRSLPHLDHTRFRPLALHHMHHADLDLADGALTRAMERYDQSMALWTQHAEQITRDHVNEGKVLLGQARCLATTDRTHATHKATQAHDLFTHADHKMLHADARALLGDLATEPAEAHPHWRAARDTYQAIGAEAKAREVAAKLGE